jgi:hypothetical protein
MRSRGHLLGIASYAHATYEDVVGGVVAELRAAITAAGDVGVPAPSPWTPDSVLETVGGISCSSIKLGPTRSAVPSWSDPPANGFSVPSRPAGGRRDRATAAACALAWELAPASSRCTTSPPLRDALTFASALGGP